MPDESPLTNLAAISLGSNINPLENLPKAVRELARFGKVKDVSSVYESAPVGFLDQPNFLNAAVLFETWLPADHIKHSALNPIEQRLCRVRDPNNVNAPRTIDLDLSLFIAPTQSLVFDKDILTRAFVAIPLAEILPEFVHPQTGQTLAEIAQTFGDVSQTLFPRPDCDLSACLKPVL